MTRVRKPADHLVDEVPGDASETAPRKEFPVVGIGASAGGLKAAEAFFDAMPANSGMAFVLVQHLDPDHKSSLAELLQNHTPMPVSQVAGDSTVLPDHVYVIPPSKSLALHGGVLSLAELDQPRGRPAVIDQFFRSLAEDREGDAIGIVLSGTGTDGARGLEAIKEHGGITLAQEDSEAEYGSMPRNAVASGSVDLVLPVAEMPAKLVEVKRQATEFEEAGHGELLKEDEAAALEAIFSQVRSMTGHDFSPYKRSTMLRRIGRRMRLRGCRYLAHYQVYLRENPSEVEPLFRDFLISVTEFFRNPDAFEVLAGRVIPDLLNAHGADETVRIWVPGCATGEEAYSLAMLFAEASDQLVRPPSVQIFATDIDESAIAAARAGRYPTSIAETVSAKRLDRFFVKEEAGYRVGKGLREMVLFTRHNLLHDPPFAKLDLVSCRNLLIYLTDEIQERAFGLFHFALRPGGYLFLGNSESLGRAVEKFSEVDRKARIFKWREGAAGSRWFPTSVPVAGRSGSQGASARTVKARRNAESTQRFLLERLAPPCVIVDDNWTVVYVSGRVGKFLEHTSGRPTQDILELAREGLALDLRLALSQAARSGSTAVRSGRVASDDGSWQEVRLKVEPIPDSDGSLVVVFDSPPEESPEDSPPVATLERESAAGGEPDAKVFAQLEAELKSSKAALQETIEDLETANEELRAGNEELQSMNEELQSASEELQTSQEELQSTNEELVTVNQELRSNIEELSEANSVLDNLASSTDIATIFLDAELQVRRYTPRANDLFHLIQADIGRPFEHVAHRFERRHLLADAKDVNSTEHPLERELRAEDGSWFLVRTRPYRTVENVVDGVVITLVDISGRKRVEDALREKDARLRFALDATGVGEWDLDPDTRTINRSLKYDQIFGYDNLLPEWNLEKLLDRVHPEDRERVAQALDRAIEGNESLDVASRIVREDGTEHWIHMRGHSLLSDSLGKRPRLLGIVEDVTERIEAERLIREFNEDLERRVRERTSELEAANEELETFTYSVSHDLRAPLRGIDGFSQVLLEEHGDRLGGSAKDYLLRIRVGAQRMGLLIDDLLNLAHLSHGEMRRETVDLSSIAEEILGQLSEQQPDRRVSFEVEEGLVAYGDGGLLEIALQNLFANAWKFTAPKEFSRIEFGVTEVDDQRAFFVRDNGVGFNMRYATRLFTPFQRLHSPTEFDGMGVGLATVQRIIRRHKGKIWAESEVDKGATFYFTLAGMPPRS